MLNIIKEKQVDKSDIEREIINLTKQKERIKKLICLKLLNLMTLKNI